MPLVRCSRCGLTLATVANGVKDGDDCNAPIPAEWRGTWFKRTLLTSCPGTLEAVGTVTLAKAS